MQRNQFSKAAFLLAVLLGALPPGVAAQDHSATDPPRMKIGAAVSYFPSYISVDSETRQWGLSVHAQVALTPARRIELAYTHVPQSNTNSSAAPRLHLVRAMFVASMPMSPASRVRLSGSIGAAVLKVDAQIIDCGEFPLCSEWAPQDGTRTAPVAGLGLGFDPGRRLGVFSDFRVYRPLGDPWSASGNPEWLTEVGVGMRLRL